jgi:hypothetical protein
MKTSGDTPRMTAEAISRMAPTRPIRVAKSTLAPKGFVTQRAFED